MNAQLSMRNSAMYGALELKRSYRIHLMWGLLLAALLHAAGLAGFSLLSSDAAPGTRMLPPRIIDTVVIEIDRFKMPPPPTTPATPLPAVVTAQFKGGIIPNPVPDEILKVDDPVPTRTEWQARYGDRIEIGEPGTQPGVPGIVGIPGEPGIHEFVYRERDPVILHRTAPIYPPQALATGLNATVTLRVLVGAKGDVRKAVVYDCSVPGMGFEEAALKAVRAWTFRPAEQNGHPIAVWMNYTISFRAG